jgi:hypothetical protein
MTMQADDIGFVVATIDDVRANLAGIDLGRLVSVIGDPSRRTAVRRALRDDAVRRLASSLSQPSVHAGASAIGSLLSRASVIRRGMPTCPEDAHQRALVGFIADLGGANLCRRQLLRILYGEFEIQAVEMSNAGE